MLEKKILDFIAKERVCSLDTLLPNGYPHSAAMHFSSDMSLTMYFSSDITSVKCQGFKKTEKIKAAVVVGFSEKEWISIQMRGSLSLIQDPQVLDVVKQLHYKKNPSSKEFEKDPNTVFLAFEPVWWRYTDFNTDPPEIITSE